MSRKYLYFIVISSSRNIDDRTAFDQKVLAVKHPKSAWDSPSFRLSYELREMLIFWPAELHFCPDILLLQGNPLIWYFLAQRSL